MQDIETEIDRSGALNGEAFASEQQVRDYFTQDNMATMFPPDVTTWTDSELVEMADYVIAHKLHCAF